MYTPSNPPSDQADFARWAMAEFTQLARLINDGWRVHRIQPSYKAPDRPREGDVVCADGTEWDPGSGAGLYQYLSGAWVAL